MGGDNQNKEMQPHQQRVVDEATELFDKIEKLDNFIGHNPIFQALPEKEKALLEKQSEYMSLYYGVLMSRIASFEQK